MFSKPKDNADALRGCGAVLVSLLICLVCCLGELELVAASPLSMTASSSDAEQSWEDDYSALKSLLSRKSNPHAYLKSNSSRTDVANVHSLIWEQDKSPTDVLRRRAVALLEDLRAHHSSPAALAALQQELDGVQKEIVSGIDERESFLRLRKLLRKASLANPLMDFDSLIFNRWTSSYGRVQEAWANTVGQEGGLYVLSGLLSGKTQIRNVLENSIFENGPFQGKRILDVSRAVRSFDLSFDDKKIVFAWVQPRPKALKIVTVNVDGSDLRQVTDGKYDDLDPVWLPNGRIVFISTRIQMTVRCNFGGATPQGVLHSVKPDGSDLIQISFHETNERYPSVDNNGRLIYMRWDYIDRDFSAAHNLWVCNPDGRDPRSPHGNYPEPNVAGINPRDGRGDRPFAEYFMRAIPGSQKYMAIASTHHAPPYGIPILIDPTIRDDNKISQVKVIVPHCLPFPSECGTYKKRGLYQGVSYVPIKKDSAYFDPWPLSETYYLIPWGPILDGGGGLQENQNRVPMKLYLVDAFGNRELVSDCNLEGGGYYLSARPLRPRQKPPEIPTATFQGERSGLPEHKRATILVANVRRTDRPWPADVKIKSMRIVQLFPRPWASPNIEKPYTGWSEGGICRASLGTAPVEDDGSVYCEAPVNKALLFQLLDEKGMAVQTMRSLTYVHPGEQLSCVGCHEDKWEAAPMPKTTPIALRRPPSKLQPDVGGVMPITFGLVKPVFQNRCIPCHTEKKQAPFSFEYNLPAPTFPDPNGKHLLSDYCYWYDSSNNNDGMGPYGGYRSTALQFGFARSRMGKALLATHSDRITRDDLQRIMLWMDLNAMLLGNPSLDAQDRQAQETGIGVFEWPAQMDRQNPTGIEVNRPVAGAPGSNQ